MGVAPCITSRLTPGTRELLSRPRMFGTKNAEHPNRHIPDLVRRHILANRARIIRVETWFGQGKPCETP
jgi:hypothetical protein